MNINREYVYYSLNSSPTIDKQFSSFLACLAEEMVTGSQGKPSTGTMGCRWNPGDVQESIKVWNTCQINISNSVWIHFECYINNIDFSS